MRLCIARWAPYMVILGMICRCMYAYLPLTGISKGSLVQILAYVRFYKLETFVLMENLPFVHTQTFRMKSMQSCIHKAPDVSQNSGLAGFLVLLCCYNSWSYLPKMTFKSCTAQRLSRLTAFFCFVFK